MPDELPTQEYNQYTKSIELYFRIRELYWTRISAFLVVAGFLFTAISLTENRPGVIVLIASFGFTISTVWHAVVQIGEREIERRSYVVEFLENEFQDSYEFDIPIQEMNTKAPQSQYDPATALVKKISSDPEHLMPIFLALLWFTVLFTYGVSSTIKILLLQF